MAVSLQKGLVVDHSHRTVLDRALNSYGNRLSTFNSSSQPTESILQFQKLRESIIESRKAFLHTQALVSESSKEEPKIENATPENKKTPSKKISFKVKKTSSVYRRNNSQSQKVTTISVNRVAELTMKFNQMVNENSTILEEPKFRKLVKRVNSQRSAENDYVKVTKNVSVKMKDLNVKVSRKPSVKTKSSSIDNSILSGKSDLSGEKNNNLCDKNSKFNISKVSLRKTSTLLDDKYEEQSILRPNTLPRELTGFQVIESQISPTSGTVRAAIEIFERRSSLTNDISVEKPKIVPKPKVPEKKISLRTKAIIVKNHESKTLIRSIEKTLEKVEEVDCTTKEDISNTTAEESCAQALEIIESHSKKCSHEEESTTLHVIIDDVNSASASASAVAIASTNSTSKTDLDEVVQILNIPSTLPNLKCDSKYETVNFKSDSPTKQVLRIEEVCSINKSSINLQLPLPLIRPNTSFLWTLKQDKSPVTSEKSTKEKESTYDLDTLYDLVDPKIAEDVSKKENELVPEIPPKPGTVKLIPPSIPPKIDKKIVLSPDEEKIYEELKDVIREGEEEDTYEYCESSANYEEVRSNTDDGYEVCASPEENIYETLPQHPPLPPKRQQQEPLPPRPPSRNSYCTIKNGEIVSNCYESIYNSELTKKEIDNESNYESIYGCQIRVPYSNRNSLASSDQQSNSLYGRYFHNGLEDNHYSGKATSDLSSSDRSDDWIDMSDVEDKSVENSEIIIVRERQKNKKSSGWSQQCREQFIKSPPKIPNNSGVDTDSDHHYETLSANNEDVHDDDYDSFDSDSDSDTSFTKININTSNTDITNNQLPDPPNGQVYMLTLLKHKAGKQMRKLRRNWSLTKNDISRSLSRMTKRKSRTDLEATGVVSTDKSKEEKLSPSSSKIITSSSEAINKRLSNSSDQSHSSNVQFQQTDSFNDQDPSEISNEKPKSLSGLFSKFRRSMSMSAESANELTSNLEKPKSTFYLTQPINIDDESKIDADNSPDSGVSLSPPTVRHKTSLIRPQSPPPPIPTDSKKTNRREKRSTSWYAEVGLFKNTEPPPPSVQKKHTSTFWYAEVGLYNTQNSTPSTSSAENSGNTGNIEIKPSDFINQDNSEEYYNLKNGSKHYNSSIRSSSSSETKKDNSMTNLPGDIQLRLQDEPLYQFYDAAVLDSVCKDGISDIDSDGYEEVGSKSTSSDFRSSTNSLRPSAMDIVCPKRNSIAFTRTLWCEIPEVYQSTVLSTLSSQQKKIQEAKFEMVTSEASYLNSLNVLTDHFIATLSSWDSITSEEIDVLFGRVKAVKDCSEKLLSDMEKCWQDSILLSGVCDIVQKHAEENFSVYVTYCENQIIIDDTLKNIKERQNIYEHLRKLESSSACQSLTLYSFLLLPMQRITRWPLLVDAVLKRLSPQDNEYLTCQYALATLNKIVNQCNEAARQKEREIEMKKLSSQLEFPKGVTPIDIICANRWLVKSGSVIHMSTRSDDTKLTFGKRFTKVLLHLFLFNDMFFVTKLKGDNNYSVIHYCSKNLVDINSTETLASLPSKDSQGKNLLFLTILENQDEKTVELLLSCNSESDKERWIEAFSPPKAEDPDETVYECWDCPQVTAIHNYTSNQPDELHVSRGDIINVLRKMGDGWYHGERIRDGQTGWFPANYTVEVANPHVRARNLKQRYRLLAFSENYLKSK